MKGVVLRVALGLAPRSRLGTGKRGGRRKVKAVASFSILGDMVKTRGRRPRECRYAGRAGRRRPCLQSDPGRRQVARRIADILFVNGLGFEGWMDRLEKSSGFKGPVVVASQGVKPHRDGGRCHHHGDEGHAKDETPPDGHAKSEDHDEHAKGEDHDADEIADPHAWQNLANGKIYVANIRDGLIAADPDGKAVYEANADAYLDAHRHRGRRRREGGARQASAGAPPHHHQPRRVRLFRLPPMASRSSRRKA